MLYYHNYTVNVNLSHSIFGIIISNNSSFSIHRYDLLLRCWSEEPGYRPNFSEIVKELNDELESMTTEVKYI